MVNFWLCETNEEKWNIIKEKNIWGARVFLRYAKRLLKGLTSTILLKKRAPIENIILSFRKSWQERTMLILILES